MQKFMNADAAEFHRDEIAKRDARIAELEKRYERTLSVLALADKYIPTSKLDAYTAEARALMVSAT